MKGSGAWRLRFTILWNGERMYCMSGHPRFCFVILLLLHPAINDGCADLLRTLSLLFMVKAVSIIYLRQRPHVELSTPRLHRYILGARPGINVKP